MSISFPAVLEEVPVVIPPGPIQDTVVWEKQLDDLFRTLRDPKEDDVKIDSDSSCPFAHARVVDPEVNYFGGGTMGEMFIFHWAEVADLVQNYSELLMEDGRCPMQRVW